MWDLRTNTCTGNHVSMKRSIWYSYSLDVSLRENVFYEFTLVFQEPVGASYTVYLQVTAKVLHQSSYKML